MFILLKITNTPLAFLSIKLSEPITVADNIFSATYTSVSITSFGFTCKDTLKIMIATKIIFFIQ